MGVSNPQYPLPPFARAHRCIRGRVRYRGTTYQAYRTHIYYMRTYILFDTLKYNIDVLMIYRTGRRRALQRDALYTRKSGFIPKCNEFLCEYIYTYAYCICIYARAGTQ